MKQLWVTKKIFFSCGWLSDTVLWSQISLSDSWPGVPLYGQNWTEHTLSSHTHSIIMHVRISRIILSRHSREPTALSDYAFLWFSAFKLFYLCIVHFYLSVIIVKYTDTRSTLVLRITKLQITKTIPTVVLADCGEGAHENHSCPLKFP